MPKYPAWKYLELVEAFGGERKVADLIRKEGFDPPPLKTITGWRMRNSIPGRWAPLLIEAAIEAGHLDQISQLRKD
jgi:hypothetical protein